MEPWRIVLPLLLGYGLDLCFGDPRWLPHPVVLMGKCISGLEKLLRRCLPNSKGGQLVGGALLALLLPLGSFGAGWLLLWGLGRIHPLLALGAESFLCYQILATKCLKDESMAVYRRLRAGDLPGARQAVGRIVGRDTACLDETGVIKAAVETVAENTGDGIVAPLCFLMVGGAPLGLLYKAINTMDSMVGYRNEKYLYFGRVPARLDDVANFLPARLAGLLMVLCAHLLPGYSGGGAWRIFRRDRRQHKSPNSAQTESAAAGALGIQLAGPGQYFGKTVEKPTIGDALRPPEARDIPRTCGLLYGTSLLTLLLCLLGRWLLWGGLL